jgi:putative tricarboxylic transport membrane protein
LNVNSIAGGIIFVFAVVYTILAIRIPPSSFKGAVIGPSVFPITIGVLLAIASLALFIQGVTKAKRQSDTEEGSIGSGILHESEEKHEQSSKKLFVIIALIFGYICLFFSLGYVLSTMLFIFSTTTYLNREYWKRNLIYSIAFPIMVFLLFNHVLAVYLPTGPFS